MKIRSEVNFEEKNGRTLSRRKEFYENGNLYKEGLYSIGQGSWEWNIPIGVVRTYSEQGILTSEEHYDEAGTLEGDSKYYTPKGELAKVVTYSNGKKTNENVLVAPPPAKER